MERTVSALIMRDGAMLLVEEQGPADEAPIWMLPGGRVEHGESPEEALRREVAEETGLRVAGEPRVAFEVEIEALLDDLRGDWKAVTYTADAEGEIPLLPDDPDGLILTAAWVPLDDALERLEVVEWYDSAPLRAYLTGTEPPGARYRYPVSGRHGSVERSAVEVRATHD